MKCCSTYWNAITILFQRKPVFISYLGNFCQQ